MIKYNPLLKSNGTQNGALLVAPSDSIVFDVPGKCIWVKGVKLLGTDHTYSFSNDNYITLTNTPGDPEDIKIGVNINNLLSELDKVRLYIGENNNTAANAQVGNPYIKLFYNNVRKQTFLIKSANDTNLTVTTDSNGNIIIENKKPDLNHNTDYRVSQLKSTDASDFRVLLKSTADDTNETNSTKYSQYLTFNPNTKILKINSNLVVTLADIYAGATSSANATAGLVPAAASAQRTYFLRGDGTWLNIVQENTWRPIQVSGSEKLGGATDTGALNFVAGTGIEVSWDNTNKRIVITNTSPDQNHNTHYTTSLYIGENNNTKANVVAANPYLKLFDDDTRRSTLRFVAGTGITIGSDANGNITITNSAPDLNHNTDENVKQTPKTDNTNRPLMMINGSTSAGELTSTSMFSTGIYANTSTKMITANGFVKAGSDNTYVLTGDGGHKALSDFSLSNHKHSWLTDITNRPFEDSIYFSSTSNWSYNPLNLSNIVYIYGGSFYNTDVSSDVAIFQWFLASGPESSTYYSMNLSMDGNILCLGKMYANLGFVKGGSSNSYVLLGGGGHKLISDFSMSDHTHQYIPISGYDGIGSLVFADNTNTTTTGNSLNGLYGRVGTNDAWRIVGYGDTNSGALEIATGDDGTEPIYVRQYDLGGNYLAYTHIARTLTLLDASGNTSVPGILTAPTFLGNIAYTYLTGSTTTANQAIVSNGTANGWVLKTLGSRAFDSTEYIPKGGFTTANTTPGGWGTITTSNGYTGVLNLVTSDSAALVIGKKAENADNSISIQVDGFFYQNEGRYKVLDEYDISHTKWGDADKLDGYHLSDLYWANIKVQTGSDSTKVPTFSLLYLTNNNAYIYFTSGTNVGILLNYQNALHWYYGDGNTNSGININSSNNIGLGTSSPTAKLHINGGVVVSNNTIWVLSNNSYGGSGNRMTLSSGHPSALPYTGSNTGKVGTIIYANGIGFRDTLNFTSGSYTYGNDSGWIRVIEEEANNGMLEIATGDDGTEPIRFRRYNTSSQIVSDVLVPNKTGTLALISDITDHDSTLAISRVSNTNNLRVSLGSVNRDITLGALAWKDKASWTSDITNRPFEDSPYYSSTGGWGWNPMSLANLTNVYGLYFHNTSVSSDIAVFLWFLASGPENSSYMSMNLSMDGNMQCLGSMYADKNLFSGGNLGVGTTSPSYKVHVNNGDIYTNLDMRARRLYLTDSNAFVYFTSGTNVGILLDYNGALHWYFGEGNTNSGINITSSNNIGIGTSAPTAKLEVNGDVVVSNNTIWVQSSTSYLGSSNRMSIGSGHPSGLEFSDTNSVNKAGVKIWANGIGIKDSYYDGRNANDSCWIRHVETTNNAGYMEIATGDDGNEVIYFNHYNTSGNIAFSSYIQQGSHYATHYYESSDIRLKHDISMMSQSIRKFKFNNDDRLYYGFIAQELETLHPELVDSSGEYKTVNYNSAICYYIAELENKVQKLEERIRKFESSLA